MMLRKVVVLPAPLRPTRQTSSPAATDRLMPPRMRLPSMSTFRFDSSNIGRPPVVLRTGSDHTRYHRRIPEEGFGRHVGQHAPLLQRHDEMRVALDEVHVVLDLDDAAHAGGFC